MMTGVSGMGGMMGAERYGGIRPNPQEMFQRDDTDGSGGIDQEELTALTDKLAERSGSTIDAESLMTEFDADEDGVLSEEEMKSAMGSVREEMGPPQGRGGGQPPMGGPMAEGGMPPGGASAMYSENSVDTESDVVSQLLESLSESEEDEDEDDLTQQWLSALDGTSESYNPIDTLI
jgi:Ca2+-binding EF-hand superfamily protein